MKYTLIAFQAHLVDLKQVNTNEKTILAQVLESTAAHRADIALGIYVFETQKGWRDMHRLRAVLIQGQRVFVELPLESALAGFFPLSIANKLSEFGNNNGAEISLLNFSD